MDLGELSHGSRRIVVWISANCHIDLGENCRAQVDHHHHAEEVFETKEEEAHRRHEEKIEKAHRAWEEKARRISRLYLGYISARSREGTPGVGRGSLAGL